MMTIKKISPQNIDLQLQNIDPILIDKCNWPKEYPYAPHVECRLAHTGRNLIIRFDVEEKYTAARVDRDNGEVWTDSCVETFIALDQTGYYNFETTCIGKMLLAFRKERNVDVVPASQQIIDTVKRTPSMPVETFEERVGDNRWSLKIEIPASALFKHKLEAWDGVKARMNLYKCGDNLSHPHFLSWNPIDVPAPDFHRPEFFREVVFE